MTLGNMRATGLRSLALSCLTCASGQRGAPL